MVHSALVKTALASIVAVLLGVAIGWRWGGDSQPTPHSVATEDRNSAQASGPDEQAETHRREQAEQLIGVDWRAWAKRVERAKTAGELETLFTELVASEDLKLRKTVGRLLGARWVEIDPTAGVRFLGEMENGTLALYPLFTDWVLRDHAAGRAGLALLPGQAAYHAQVAVLTGLLARRAPDASLEFSRATRKFVDRGSREAWRDLARARPEEFAALLAEIETANLKRGARYSAFTLVRIAAEGLAERDPEAAIAWGESLFVKMQHDAMSTAMRTWAKNDPVTLAQRIAQWKKESPQSPRARAAGLLVQIALSKAMAGEDLAIAAKWLGGKGVHPKSFAEALAAKLARNERSPAEVFDAVAKVESYNNNLQVTVFDKLWDRMPVEQLEGAFGDLQARPEGTARTLALGGLLRTTMELDPSRAAALALRIPPGTERDALIGEMMRRTDLERRAGTAASLVRALPASDQPVAVGELFARDLDPSGDATGIFDPSPFAEVLAAAPASPTRSLAVERLALHWGTFDPEGAMAWGAAFPEEEAVAATSAAARGWVHQDAWSLAEYLLERPEGRLRDAATATLVDSVRETEPDSAWAWTAHIDDSAVRAETRRAVIAAWSAQRPVEAREAIESADVPNDEREALRALLKQ